MKISKEQIYNRQVTLSEIGTKGQNKLGKAKVAIVGCGGLGSAVAVYLAGSGIGRLHLIDYDTIDVSNLHRQIFYGIEDIGKSKAIQLRDHINKISPFVEVSLSQNPVTKLNIETELNDFSLIVDCTDSIATKYLLNDFCVLNDKTLFYGSLYKHDGYVSVFHSKQKNQFTANLRDAFPELPKEAIPNCSEVGTLNPIVGIIALMQANEVIKIVCHIGKPLFNQILIYNTLENSQYKMKLKPAVSKSDIQKIFESESYYDIRCEVQDEELIILAEDFKIKMNDPDLEVISVLEDLNIDLPFHVDAKIPLSQFDVTRLNLTENKDLVVVCAKGISSYKATQLIKQEFPQKKVFSLKNGIEKFQ